MSGHVLALNDDMLTEAGADFAAPQAKTLIIACGALAREILALREQLGAESVGLRCLPALLHNRPDQIPGRVAAAVAEARAEGFERILIGYADCGTGGLLAQKCGELSVEMIAGPHCYAFFDGQSAFAARAEAEIGAFYLTDFLARQFDALVWRGLGLDRHPDLLPMYFGNYDRVVHLAQTEDAALDAAAEAAAKKLGLAYHRRVTGYGELGAFVRRAADYSG